MNPHPAPRIPFALALLAASSLAGAGCLRVIHDTQYIFPDLAQPDLAQPDMVQPLHVQAIFVVQLARASGNLAPAYAAIINGLQAALASRLVFVDEWAVLPIAGPEDGVPAFVHGGSGSLLGPQVTDVGAVLARAAATGLYDAPARGGAAEQWNLADIAGRLDSATLPPELTGGQSQPAFSSLLDRVLVITVQPARRRCALADPACRIGVYAPENYFEGDFWMRMASGYVPRNRISQLFITTSEEEAPAAFATRCAAVPGFPRTLLDVMEPSPVRYYGPLASALAGDGLRVAQFDLCSLLGSGGASSLALLAAQLASP